MSILENISNLTLINIVAHCFITISLVLLLVASLLDGYWRSKESYKQFMYSIIITILQCCLVAIYLTIELQDTTTQFIRAFYMISVYLVCTMNIPKIMNVIYIIEEKIEIKSWIKKFVTICPGIVGFIAVIYVGFLDTSITNLFYDYANDPIIEMVYIFNFLLALFGCYVSIRYHKYVGIKASSNYCSFLLIPCIAYFFPSWHFLLTDALSAYVFFIMYVGMWQSKKYELIEKEKNIAEVNEQLIESKTETMISQIQPHFLYNALSSIAALCEVDPKKAQQVTINFSDYLRNNLKSITEKTPIPFDRELKHTKLYTSIEQVRFDSMINIEYDIKIKDFNIPSLTLQPIVENAIKHGITKKENGGTIKISTYDDEDYYYVKVEDDGVGYDTNQVKNDERLHLGVNTVGYRLKNMSSGSLDIQSNIGVGTVATITIPKKLGGVLKDDYLRR